MWQAVSTISISYPCKLCDNRSDSACMFYLSAEHIKTRYCKGYHIVNTAIRWMCYAPNPHNYHHSLSQLFYCLLFCCPETSLLCSSVHNAVTNPDKRCSFKPICNTIQPLSLLILTSHFFLPSYFIGRAWVALHVCNVRLDNCADSIFPYECCIHAASYCRGSWNDNCKCHDMVSK